ncbi:MAG: S8 family serine peptidase [Chitinophagales bacterium]|nr:S8 family serine peptidase [Chitinophagales bacterium]
MVRVKLYFYLKARLPMKRHTGWLRKLLLLLALLWLLPAAAQQAIMNYELRQALRTDGQRTVSLIVEGPVDEVAEFVRARGGTFKFSVGRLSSVSLPLHQVDELSRLSGVRRIEGLHGTGQTLDDMTLLNAHVLPVHQGIAPLAQGYDGQGVVIGFLDSGLDWKHPDFQHPDGSTRIAFLWDQYSLAGGVTPQPYGYGQEWDAAAINAGQCQHFPGANFGHGTNVAGIAAGNGLAVNNYLGVAPKADIIAVSIAFNENFLSNVVDATDYVFSKAAQMGKPCVINASIGTYSGSHDGYDLPAQLIAALLDQQPGRVFVCAAGNAGNIPFHLGYATSPDSSFTWFKSVGAPAQVLFQFWVSKKDAAGFQFAFGADNTNPWQFLGRTRYYHLINDFPLSGGYAELYDTLYDGTTRLGTLTLGVTEYDSTYSCNVTIKPDVTTHYWRFITNGTGSFDLWSHPATNGTSEMVTTNLPSSSVFPDISRYKLPDTRKTLVSSFSCSDRTITVANYNNRKTYFDFFGNLVTMTDDAGSIAVSSSRGPTRDERQKPDVAAPGNTTLTAGELSFLATTILIQPFKVALGGMHNRNGGTSMASPVVSGIAALYLQKDPQADWKKIKDALQLTAMEDSYTGFSLPDHRWGYGKVNAFAALTASILYGCTDPFSLNFNPSATVDDGSCIPIVLGCTNPLATNYNPLANMDDGSCLFVGMPAADADRQLFCYPNPASSALAVLWTPDPQIRRICITDLLGTIWHDLPADASGRQWIDLSGLNSGTYFCHLLADDHRMASARIVVHR